MKCAHGLTGGAILLFAVIWPARAVANGRFPAAQYVVTGGDAAPNVVVLRTTFGLVISEDAGKTFHWMCEESLGYAGSSFDPAVATDANGRIHVGLYDGLVRVDGTRCSPARLPAFEGEFVSDLDRTPSGKSLVAVTSTGFLERSNYVFRSDDGGTTWARLGKGLPATQLSTVEIAASKASRVYVSGLQLSPRKTVVLRSDDGGASFTETAFPFPDAVGAYIAAVDRTRPDTVYVRAAIQEADGTPRTALVRTDDAGATYQELARGQGDMLGFALSDDGETVYYGGPDVRDGLLRSTDRGATFTRVASVHVRCLRTDGKALWICGTETADGFSLARSIDGGETIVPMLRLGEIAGPMACGPGSLSESTCAARWPSVRAGFPALPTDAPDAGGSADASVADAPEALDSSAAPVVEEGRGGCSVNDGESSGGHAWWSLLALAVMWFSNATSRSCRSKREHTVDLEG